MTEKALPCFIHFISERGGTCIRTSIAGVDGQTCIGIYTKKEILRALL